MEQMHAVGVTSNIYQQIENQSTIQKTNYPEINETSVELPQYINQISQILKHKEIEEKGYIKSLMAVVSNAEALKNMAISDALVEIINIMNQYNTKVYWTKSGDVLFGASLKYSDGSIARADRESLVELVNGIIYHRQPFQITIRENDSNIYCINPDRFVKLLYPVGINVKVEKIFFQKPVNEETELDRFAIQLIDSDYIPKDSFDKVQIASILEKDKKECCLDLINLLEEKLNSLKQNSGSKEEKEYQLLFCLKEIFKIHPFQDANGRIIGSFLFYIIAMKYDLPLIPIVHLQPNLGMFTVENLVYSYRREQENFAVNFETHENHLNCLLSLYLKICHDKPTIQANHFAKLIIKHGWVNKLLQESDKTTHIIDCLLAIEHNITTIENNILKNIMLNMVPKLSTVSLDYLNAFSKMMTDILKKDFNLVIRRCATHDVFEPILFFLLDDANKNEFEINLEITSKDGRNPLQIAKDFKMDKMMNLIRSKM